MSDTVSQTYLVVSNLVDGYRLDVTYRIVGEPHVWQYLRAQQLTLEELSVLVDAAIAAVVPGHRAPSMPGQLPLI